MNKLYHTTRYISSAYNISQLPPDKGKEVAFAGRSNAGKSSAINTITQSRDLARVSRRPGRTQLINYFKVTETAHLVDLPGYGYAKVPEKMRKHWQHTLQKYFQERQSLQGLMLIMDIRHPLQPLDWQMINWCKQAELESHIVLTKADKVSRNAANKSLYETKHLLEDAGVETTLQLFSAHNKTGIDDAHTIIDQWLKPVQTL